MADTPPFYRGHEGFQEVLADEELSRPGKTIRVYNYGSLSSGERLYVIGSGGQLFDAATRSKVEVREVLSLESASDGWSVEGFGLTLLPDEEIRKIFQ